MPQIGNLLSAAIDTPSYQKVCGQVWRAPQHCMARRAGRTPSIPCSRQAQAHPAARRAKRKFLSIFAAGQKNESVSMDRNKEDMVMGAEEPFPILDDVELPPAKGRAARPRKSDVDLIQKEKKASLERSARFDKRSDSLRRLFSTPSLMKGEDSNVYAELYAQVEEAVQPQDVFDQMMLTDVTNHFWEQQRYRRCTGTVINSKRRAALEKILHEAIGLNDVDA